LAASSNHLRVPIFICGFATPEVAVVTRNSWNAADARLGYITYYDGAAAHDVFRKLNSAKK
jgi:hypothetical protein